MLMEIYLKNSEFCTRKTNPLDEGTLCKEEDENDWQGDIFAEQLPGVKFAEQ